MDNPLLSIKRGFRKSYDQCMVWMLPKKRCLFLKKNYKDVKVCLFNRKELENGMMNVT